MSVTNQLIPVRCNLNLQTNETKMLKFCSGSHGLWTPLHAATEQGHAAVTELLIEARSNLDVRTEDGFMPLNTAAHLWHAIADQLISARCNIDIQNECDGSTSLHMAANQGHATVIKKLLVAQCTVDLQAKNGATPLYVVVGKGHEAVTKQLIELDVTSIFRTTMGARRSTSRYSEGMTQSRSS